MSTIKLRAKMKGDHAEIKAIITHPMATGLAKDKATGEIIPAHYIQEVTIEADGKTILTGDWGGSISKNPYFSFRFSNGKKDMPIKLTWKDNQGKSDTTETKIK